MKCNLNGKYQEPYRTAAECKEAEQITTKIARYCLYMNGPAEVPIMYDLPVDKGEHDV